MASAYPRTYTQNTYSLSDNVSLLHAAHVVKLGGSVALLQENFNLPGLTSSVQFLSWPDFLLGLMEATMAQEHSAMSFHPLISLVFLTDSSQDGKAPLSYKMIIG